ncbi:hypothetical protein M3P05_06450 [Sansalvadorimonas sp. 2012CJ34-2]|uniref:Uncharacterized protein n=1 Tax=Parendozoicomonas callyspongiae TaxID=2942213 RepID=A0ABT0PDZ8_9GAMM|nr:hypothetical protein [Sansalvadorimonas sp. 2012CJ34-2]MCL6269580.1 hypothetical protein [Sansalvadorimonas sp. 2012CJ34-2]
MTSASIKRKWPLHLAMTSLAALISVSSVANDQVADDEWDDWGDEERLDDVDMDSWDSDDVSTVSGFIEAGIGRRLQTDSAIKERNTLSEARARIEYQYFHDLFSLEALGDVIYDDVLNEGEWQTRKLVAQFSPTDNIDMKVGRQVLTWGTGDYLFLNDLFPKDWQAFFSGRDDEYLKAPSDSIMGSWYGPLVSVDLVLTPKFKPDNSLNGERFSFFSPLAGKQVAPNPKLNPDEPTGATWSGRLATTHQGIEYALYGHIGYWPTPVGINNQGKATYPELDTWGASLRSPLGKGLFNTEMAWYDSREDRSGKDPKIPNSQLRWLAGYEQEVATNLTAAVQYYLEWTQDYDDLKKYSSKPQYEQDEYRQLLTLRFTKLAMQQKLTWSLFTFWSPTDQDAYLRPSVSYRLDDNWEFATGANLFMGDDKHTFFGQHEDNSNAWARIRFNY